MAEPTPADELRQAATTLRETAAKASGGRWYVFEDAEDPEYASLFWVCSDQAGPITADMSEGGVCIERDSDEHGRGDADWIALMDPGLAEPLAVWLESWDGFDVPESAPHSDDWEYALKVARAINAKREGNHG